MDTPMRRLIVAFVPIFLVASFAPAQPMPPGGPVQRPTFSPYLSLLSNTGSPALNYFGLVRPQQQMAQQFGQLQAQQQQTAALVNQAIGQEAAVLNEILAPTGNVATFNNTGNYFNRFGGQNAAFGRTSAASFGQPGGANILQRPSFAGGSGAGGLAAPRRR